MLLCALWIPIVLLFCSLPRRASGDCNETDIACTLASYNCTVNAANAIRASDLIKQCSLSLVQMGMDRITFDVFLQETNGTITLELASGIRTLELTVYETASIGFNKDQTDIVTLKLSGTETSTLYCPYNVLDYFPNILSLSLIHVALDNLSFQATDLSQINLKYLTLPLEVTILPSLWTQTPDLSDLTLEQTEDSVWYNLNTNSFDNVEYGFLSLNGIQNLYYNQFASVIGVTALNLSGFFSDFTFDENALAGVDGVKELYIYQLPNFDLLEKQTFPNLRVFVTDSVTLPQEFFESQKALSTIIAIINPFHCDCEMAWLSYVSNELGWSVTGTCETPASLNGNSIADSSNYISCSAQSYHCFNDTFICPTESICVNTADSAYCDCGEGYAVNETSTSCEDINECSSANNCEHTCANTAGSYTCSCKFGFSLESDMFSCISGVSQLTAQALIALISLLLQIYLL